MTGRRSGGWRQPPVLRHRGKTIDRDNRDIMRRGVECECSRVNAVHDLINAIFTGWARRIWILNVVERRGGRAVTARRGSDLDRPVMCRTIMPKPAATENGRRDHDKHGQQAEIYENAFHTRCLHENCK